MSQNILIIGGSRNIGYLAGVRLLDLGHTVHFMLRSSSVFDNDVAIQKHVASKKAILIQGDALVKEDVARVFKESSTNGPIDTLLFTVGFTGTPGFSITKGFQISPPNLVTQAMFNVLTEIPQLIQPPRIIALTTSGVSKSSRSEVPFPLKAMYGYLIAPALRDKLGVERVLYHCAGWDWNTKDGEPKEDIMGEAWRNRQGLPAPGTLKEVMVLRPALLTDGECLADKNSSSGKLPYRAGEGEVGGWTVSRKDVAHFIVDVVTHQELWNKYGRKQVSIAY